MIRETSRACCMMDVTCSIQYGATSRFSFNIIGRATALSRGLFSFSLTLWAIPEPHLLLLIDSEGELLCCQRLHAGPFMSSHARGLILVESSYK